MDEDYHKFELENGLTLILVPIKDSQSATVLVMVRTGSRDEPARLAGISHFLEHMVFKGTHKYPTAMAISSAIDSIGGEFNAFTSKEFTGFYIKLAINHLERGVDVLSEMLTRPKLAPDAIEREMGVIIEEINMYEDLPPRKAAYEYERLLYGDTSLGRETIGSRETVKALRRKDFVDYLSKRYVSGRTVVGVVGGIGGNINKSKGVEWIGKLVAEKFAGLPAGQDGWGMPVKIAQKEPGVRLFKKETGQAHFVLGVHGFKRGHPDRYALAVLATLMGGNMSSRLFTEIREKRGLAYYVKADMDTFFDVGNLNVSAGVVLSKLDEAVRVIVEQFGLMCLKEGKGSISDEEVSKAREYLKGRFILQLEDSHEVADHFVRRFLLERKVITPEKFLALIDAVTREDVVRVASKVFVDRNLNLAVVGPYSGKDRQRFLRILGGRV
jgi:predicted Zn-dependent peptidase